MVDSKQEPCFGMVDTFSEIYVGNEMADSPDINQIRRYMRQAFEDKEDRAQRASYGIEDSYEYSYSKVGETMKSILNDKTAPYQQNEKHREMHRIAK